MENTSILTKELSEQYTFLLFGFFSVTCTYRSLTVC